MKETTSLCPKCYTEIPAVIQKRDDAAWMTKVCPAHGTFEAMVERDYRWWDLSQRMPNRGIYGGYIVDVTSRCNLSCKHCFHGKDGHDRGVEEIMSELRAREKDGQIILFGGEPTIHNDFINVSKTVNNEFGPLTMVTNGTMTSDPLFLEEITPYFLAAKGQTAICVSTHPESHGADYKTLDNARRQGVRLHSVLYSIDNIDQIQKAVDLAKEYKDVINNVRIRAVAQLWAESGAPDRLFVSDIMRKLSEIGRMSLIKGEHHVTGFAHVLLDGVHLIPAAFPDVERVDLQEIDCPPWYMAKDKKVYNIATALLINEGIDKGYYQGKQIENIDGFA